jgi:hypothetical protein
MSILVGFYGDSHVGCVWGSETTHDKVFSGDQISGNAPFRVVAKLKYRSDIIPTSLQRLENH